MMTSILKDGPLRKLLRERKGQSGIGSDEKLKALEAITHDILNLIQSEKDAIQAYQHVINIYGQFGWRQIFSDIQADEKEHLEKLRTMLVAIEEQYVKTGEIKS